MLLLLIGALIAPVAAMAVDTGATPATLAAFLVPFAWLVPIVVAVVNRVKDTFGPATWVLWLVGWITGVTSTLIVFYFGALPDAARVVLAGSAVFLASAGVFDLFKTFGTFTAPTPTSTGE